MMRVFIQNNLPNYLFLMAEKMPLLCGLLTLLIASCGALFLENSYQHLLLLKQTEISLKSTMASDANHLLQNCATGEKKPHTATLNLLETSAVENDLIVQNIAQKQNLLKTMEWVVVGEYHNIIAWLEFMATQPVLLSDFRIWREQTPLPTLFFSTEIIIYESPLCRKNN